MGENKIFKLIIVGGVAYGIYKLSGLMNLGNNLNVKVTNPRIHGIVANGVEFRCEVQLQNPTKDSLTLTQPYVKLLSKGQVIASSPVIDNTIELKPMSQATTDSIKLQLSWLDIISVLRKLNISVPSFSISDISDNIMSLLKKMSLSIEYSTYANNVFYKDSENLTGTGSLGITAATKRNIKDSSKYDNLFPTPDFIDKEVNANASTMTDTLPEMGKVIRTYRKDTSRLAAMLQTSVLKDTLYKDWKFVYDHMQYKLDTRGREELRRPAVAWFHSRYSQNRHSPEDKFNIGVDCDCYTIFLCTLLLNQGIQPIIRVSDYGKGWQHVYPIVPNPQKKFNPLDKNTYYILDDVMEEFNTEKTFTKHKDFTMQELGIPLHVLHGINSDSDEKEISLLGLGMSKNPSETEIYDYLIKTRDVIKSNPDAIRTIEYPEGFLKMLNYAIENFNTPNRNKALEVLARNEAEINRLNGITYEDLDGLHGDDDFLNGINDIDNFEGVDGDDILVFDGLGKFFRNKEERKERKITRKENRENKRMERKERRETNKDERKNTKGFFRKLNVGLKQGGKGFIRLNPVVIASRNGFLLALRLNMFRMASRLKWAYATPEQVQKAGISEVDYEAAKKSLEETEKMFVDKLGGTKTALKTSILSSKHGSIDGLGSIENDEQNFYGLGMSDPVTVAMITAASVPIAFVVKTISKNFKDKEAKDDTSTTDETDTTDEKEETESTEGFGSIGDDVMELGEALELGLFKKKTKEEKEKEKEERLKKRKEKKEKKKKDKEEKKKKKGDKKKKKDEEKKNHKQEEQEEKDKEKSDENEDSKGGSSIDTDTIVDATRNIFQKLKEKNKKRKLEEDNIPDTNPDNNPDYNPNNNNTHQNNPQGEGVFKKILNVVKANPLITTLSIAGITYFTVPPVRKFVNSIFSPKKAEPKSDEVKGFALAGTKQIKRNKKKTVHQEGKKKITAITLK